MDESLKARLIGAAVLVAVAVLLIPELLSGRKPVESAAGEGDSPRGTRTFTIELGGGPGPPVGASSDGTAQAVRELASASASVPAPTPTPTPTTAAAPAPAPADAAAAAVPPAAAERSPQIEQRSEPVTPAPLVGEWAVQVGAFGSADTARGLVKQLTGEGYHAYVAPIQRGGKTLHRVRVGPEAQKAGAERLAGQLKAKGLPATVVRND